MNQDLRDSFHSIFLHLQMRSASKVQGIFWHDPLTTHPFYRKEGFRSFLIHSHSVALRPEQNPKSSQAALHEKRHVTVMNTDTWTQEQFGKLLTLNTDHHCFQKSNQKLCYTRRKPNIRRRRGHWYTSLNFPEVRGCFSRRTSVLVLQPASVSCWKHLEHHEEENQTTASTDWGAAQVFVQ